jgi:hypothetical protein
MSLRPWAYAYKESAFAEMPLSVEVFFAWINVDVTQLLIDPVQGHEIAGLERIS